MLIFNNLFSNGDKTSSRKNAAKALPHSSFSNRDRNGYIFKHPSIIGTAMILVLSIVITLICIYFLFMGLLLTSFSTDLFRLGVLISGISLLCLLVNIFLIVKSIREIKYKARYDVYVKLINWKKIVFIKIIASSSKHKESTVIKDLKWAVERKLIPQGHFNNDKTVFMLFDNIYELYMAKPDFFDKCFQHGSVDILNDDFK